MIQGETDVQEAGEVTSSPCCDSPKCDAPPQAGHSGEGVPPAQPVPECPICFTTYDSAFRAPLRLPLCGHTFCLVCLSRMSLFPAQPEGFQCPLCCTPVPLPPGGAPCLPPNAELLSRLPQEQSGTLKRVWLEGPVLCHWTGPEGGGAPAEGVVRLPLIGAPPTAGGGAGGGEGQPVAMVTVLSRHRVDSCRNIRGVALISAVLFVIIFFAIFLPVYFQR